MQYQIMKISNKVIQERKRDITSLAFNKLSPESQQIARLMMRTYNDNRKYKYTIDDIREHGLNGGWRAIQNAFLELESREFGEVKQFENLIYFQMSIPALQSVI